MLYSMMHKALYDIERNKVMNKQGRVCLVRGMAVMMAIALIGAILSVKGMTAEASGIRLTKSSLSLKVGQSRQLKVKGTKKKVTWSVSNGKIVKVTKKGKVTAKKAGTAKVYAKVKGKKLICRVKVVSKPKKTVKPVSSAIPTLSPTGTPTISTEPSVAPEKTDIPGKTENPQATTVPDYMQDALAVIKVGETKITTSAGIRITYTACQKLLIIQMENTTKNAKSVSLETDLIDSKGNLLCGQSILYPESISHLSAGQVYYTYAQCTDCCDMEAYVIKKLQVRQSYSTEVDCLANIKVTSESGVIEKNAGITELIYEYTGKDISKLYGKSVHIYGAVVYYDAEDNMVDFFNVRETIKLSKENNKTVGRVFSLDDSIDHYKVILSGAEYSSDDYSYDGDEEAALHARTAT